MATRAISIPRGGARIRARVAPGWAGRVALPVAGLLVVATAVAGLGLGLSRLPASGPGVTQTSAAAVALPGSIATLDTIGEVVPASIPRSPDPAGGLVFVRCTNLWIANADGSNARRLLAMPGLSSPALSPDGRSIAFFGAGPDGSTRLWLAAADGSSTRLLGSLAQAGRPVSGETNGLTWSPSGDRLAFALRPLLAARAGRWAIWTLSLENGSFTRVGAGGPAPFWIGRQLFASDPETGVVSALWGRDWAAKRLSSAGVVVSAGLASGWWTSWQEDTALLLRAPDGDLELAWRARYSRRTTVTTEAPDGYRFDPTAPPAVTELGPVAVSLVDASGGRDLGLLDPVTERWRILDYAWDPAWSPAPAATGTTASADASRLVSSLLWSLDRPERARLLLAEPADRRLVPFARTSFTFGEPVAARDGSWVVGATAYGLMERGFGARDLSIAIRSMDGRLAATIRPEGPVERIATVDEAVAFLDRLLTAEVIPPDGLPAGTHLAARPIYAWSWRGRTEGNLTLVAPGIGKMTFHYGSAGFGCGSSPVPLELGTGTAAITTDPATSGGWNTVAWPARPRSSSGPFGISGNVSTTTLVAIAERMDRARLASSPA